MSNKKKIIPEDYCKNVEQLNEWINSINWSMDKKNGDISTKESQEKIACYLVSSIFNMPTLKKEHYDAILNSINDKLDYNSKITFYLMLYYGNCKDSKNTGSILIFNYVKEKIIAEYFKDSNINFNQFIVEKKEFDLSLIVKMVFEFLDNDRKLTLKNKTVLCYIIMLCIGNSNYKYKSKYSKDVEREIIEYIVNKYIKNQDKIKLFEFMPTMFFGNDIKNDSFVQNINGIEYLYYGLDKKLKEALIEKENHINMISYLNEVKSAQLNEINNLSTEIQNLKLYELNLKNELEALNNRLNAEQNRVHFEKNKYEQSILTMKKSMLNSLKKKLDLEIDGIEESIRFIPDDKKNKIQKRIDRINNILKEDLGD